MSGKRDLNPLGTDEFIGMLEEHARKRLRRFPWLKVPEPLEVVNIAVVMLLEDEKRETPSWDPTVALEIHMKRLIRHIVTDAARLVEHARRVELEPEEVESIPGFAADPYEKVRLREMLEICRTCPALEGCRLLEIVDALGVDFWDDPSDRRSLLASLFGRSGDYVDRQLKKFWNLVRGLDQGAPTEDARSLGGCRFGSDCMAAKRRTPKGSASEGA
jgi:hypothetical protein